MLNIFRRKPSPPLKEAIRLIAQASEIVMAHKRNKQFMPSKDDLALLQQIEQELDSGHSAASYVYRCMQQRAEGEPEGAKKFTDPAAFDYHYPS